MTGIWFKNKRLSQWLLILILANTGSLSVAAAQDASDLQAIPWGSLIAPGVTEFEDPFAQLDSDQLFLLSGWASLKEQEETASLTHQQQDTLASIEVSLLGQGVNIDGLMARRWEVAELRRAAAVSPNPDLDDVTLSISGFVIPAPRLEDGRMLFYLAEEEGVFVDLPAPVQNQLVQVVFDGNVDIYLYQPVKVTGRMKIEITDRKMWFFGGEIPIISAYTLDAGAVQGVEFIAHANHKTKTE